MLSKLHQSKTRLAVLAAALTMCASLPAAEPDDGSAKRTLAGQMCPSGSFVIGFDAAGDIVWVGKLTGNTLASNDCSVETILDTKLWIYAPDQNPYTGELMVLPYGVLNPIEFPTHYGFRATVEVPEAQ